MAETGNVGVGCRASDVVGLDLDRHRDGHDGVASFAAVFAAHGDASWPDTLTVRTPSGGLHVYFRAGGRALPSPRRRPRPRRRR